MGGRIRHHLAETLLWILAVLGLIAMVLVCLAYLFNISIILFRTGSMEPTIPAGSAAIVREVPAEEVSVGDVLTVDRPGAALPVTHRVTSVEAGAIPGERIITMQGDANDSPDPSPYTISEARLVLGSVPGLAHVIHRMGDPYVMGGITLAASLLVGWAFWPKRAPEKSPTQSQRPRHGRSGSTYALGALGVIAVPLGILAVPDEAAAQLGDVEEVQRETVQSQYITLHSAYIPEQRVGMFPGDSARWDVSVAVAAPEPGVVRTRVSMYGDFPLEVTVTSCDRPWTEGVEVPGPAQSFCLGNSRTLLDDVEIDGSENRLWLQEFSSDQEMWLRIDAEMPEAAPHEFSGNATVRLHAEVSGDRAEITSSDLQADSEHNGSGAHYDPDHDDSLARTGFRWGALILLATVLVVIGRALYVRSRQGVRLPLRGDIR